MFDEHVYLPNLWYGIPATYPPVQVEGEEASQAHLLLEMQEGHSTHNEVKMEGYVEVSHDAFGRFSIVRRIIDFPYPRGCAWCGNTRPGNDTLFNYGVEYDDRPGRPNWDNKNFCSKGCRDAYFL